MCDVYSMQVTTSLCITEHRQKHNFHLSPKAQHFCSQSTCLLGFTPTSLRIYGNCCSISSALMLKSLSAHFCFSVCTTRPKTFPPASTQIQHPCIYVFTIKKYHKYKSITNVLPTFYHKAVNKQLHGEPGTKLNYKGL